MMYDTTKLTVELGEIIKAGVNIFDFDYEYKGLDKSAFEQKVIDHYYFRQIGQETTGRFKHYFKTRILEIMPYYNQLFDSEKLMAEQGDPFEAYNLTETFTRDVKATGKTTDSQTSSATSSGSTSRDDTANITNTKTVDNTQKFSDTPQGDIANLDDHLTNATINTGTETDTQTHTANGGDTSESNSSGTATGETNRDDTTQETYTMTRRGNIGVQPFGMEIKYLRDSFLNIDQMIIKELNDLFLGVY